MVAVAARPARGLIRLYDVFFSFRLHSVPAFPPLVPRGSRIHFEQTDILPRLPLFLSFVSPFFSFTRKATPASKYCGERIKRRSRSVAPITFEAIVIFPIPTIGGGGMNSDVIFRRPLFLSQRCDNTLYTRE